MYTVYIYCILYIYIDVVPLMKTAGVVINSAHCVYSIGLKYFCCCLSPFHLVIYIYIYIMLYVYIYCLLYIYIYLLRQYVFYKNGWSDK